MVEERTAGVPPQKEGRAMGRAMAMVRTGMALLRTGVAAWRERRRYARREGALGKSRGKMEPWHPHISRLLDLHLPQHRGLVWRAIRGLYEYNLLQWHVLNGPGASIRAKQWNAMSAPPSNRASWLWALVGGVTGLISFTVMAVSNWSVELFGVWTWVVWLPTGALLFGYGAYAFTAEKPYWRGMMRIYVNERNSLVTEEEATAALEFSAPKVVFAHRRAEWRYRRGRPYMWLMLPLGARFHTGTPDEWDEGYWTPATSTAVPGGARPHVVLFTAPWCRHPKLYEVMDELEAEYAAQVEWRLVDVDEEPALAEALQIRNVPTLVVFRGGRPVEQILGPAPKEEIRRRINAALVGEPEVKEGGHLLSLPWTHTLDFVFLKDDPYTADDDAVLTQRNIDRQVDRNAREYWDINANVGVEPENWLVPILPYVAAVSMVVLSGLAFIMMIG